MVRVRPYTGSVKERTDGIVDMGHVNIAQRRERLCIRLEWQQPFHGDLNVDDRFGIQTWHGRRAFVVDATNEGAKGSRNPISFRLEVQNPSRIVRHDLQSFAHVVAPSPCSSPTPCETTIALVSHAERVA